MSKDDMSGATLYRIGFAIFVVALVLNANSSYVASVQASYRLINADSSMLLNETYAYLALAFILILELVGLIMFKWIKRAVATL